ncbi:MAG TPA: hypothetical protein VKP88_02095, partial [Candidatus Paceibacterota bacterium]|nr:hypothetical protein [Candidatus Paceibacterota bacterium]
TFADPTVEDAVYTPSAADITAGSVTLTMTVTGTNPGCGSTTASDDIVININPLPAITITSGPSCDPSLLTYTTVVDVTSGSTVTSPAANSVTNTSGDTWTIVANVGTNITIVATNPTTTCENSIGVNSPVCSCPPIAAPTSGGDVDYCEGSPIPTLTATVPAGFTVNWFDAPTGGTLLLAGSTTYTPAGPGTYYAEAEEISSGCTSADRTAITLTENTAPTADAGPASADICAGDDYTASATATDGSIAWTTSGTGTFADPTVEDAVYTPSAADITAGSVTLTMTVTGTNPGCGSTVVSDDVTLNISPAPTADAGVASADICAGDDYTASATATNGSIAWTSSG